MEFIYFNYIILPLLIFLARIVDVSLGTVRIIFTTKGHKNLASILGFFEVLIWIMIIGKIMENMKSPWLYVVYALGFSAGTYVGMYLDEKLCVGKVMVRLIIKRNDKELLNNLREANYPLTVVNAVSGREMKRAAIVFSVINRKKLKKFLDIVNSTNPKAFYSIEDVRQVRDIENIESSKIGEFVHIKKRK